MTPLANESQGTHNGEPGEIRNLVERIDPPHLKQRVRKTYAEHERPYKCDICHRTYAFEHSRNQHVRVKHIGPAPKMRSSADAVLRPKEVAPMVPARTFVPISSLTATADAGGGIHYVKVWNNEGVPASTNYLPNSVVIPHNTQIGVQRTCRNHRIQGTANNPQQMDKIHTQQGCGNYKQQCNASYGAQPTCQQAQPSYNSRSRQMNTVQRANTGQEERGIALQSQQAYIDDMQPVTSNCLKQSDSQSQTNNNQLQHVNLSHLQQAPSNLMQQTVGNHVDSSQANRHIQDKRCRLQQSRSSNQTQNDFNQRGSTSVIGDPKGPYGDVIGDLQSVFRSVSDFPTAGSGICSMPSTHMAKGDQSVGDTYMPGGYRPKSISEKKQESKSAQWHHPTNNQAGPDCPRSNPRLSSINAMVMQRKDNGQVSRKLSSMSTHSAKVQRKSDTGMHPMSLDDISASISQGNGGRVVVDTDGVGGANPQSQNTAEILRKDGADLQHQLLGTTTIPIRRFTSPEVFDIDTFFHDRGISTASNVDCGSLFKQPCSQHQLAVRQATNPSPNSSQRELQTQTSAETVHSTQMNRDLDHTKDVKEGATQPLQTRSCTSRNLQQQNTANFDLEPNSSTHSVASYSRSLDNTKGDGLNFLEQLLRESANKVDMSQTTLNRLRSNQSCPLPGETTGDGRKKVSSKFTNDTWVQNASFDDNATVVDGRQGVPTNLEQQQVQQRQQARQQHEQERQRRQQVRTNQELAHKHHSHDSNPQTALDCKNLSLITVGQVRAEMSSIAEGIDMESQSITQCRQESTNTQQAPRATIRSFSGNARMVRDGKSSNSNITDAHNSSENDGRVEGNDVDDSASTGTDSEEDQNLYDPISSGNVSANSGAQTVQRYSAKTKANSKNKSGTCDASATAQTAKDDKNSVYNTAASQVQDQNIAQSSSSLAGNHGSMVEKYGSDLMRPINRCGGGLPSPLDIDAVCSILQFLEDGGSNNNTSWFGSQ